MRLERSLAGSWQFQLDPDGLVNAATFAPDRSIPVPLPWQAAFPELERYSGYAWYGTIVALTEDWLSGELLLKFGAVDYWCQVFVNGRLVGEHEGGYTPFTFPIRAFVSAGDNQIAVRVYDMAQTSIVIPRWPEDAAPPATLFDATAVPHGKQDWYINVGGLWQDVTLTAVPRTYIQQAHLTPDPHSGRVRVAVTLAGALDGAGSLAVTVGAAAASTALVAGQAAYELTLTVDQPRLWSPDDPALYTAAVTLGAPAAAAADALSVRFGFRELTTANGQLLLNGQPFYLLSALDQDYYPETIYTVPSADYLRDEFAKAKALGFNSLRCHIKPPDPLYLDLADEMGLLIWAEIPSWRTFHVKPSQLPDGRDVTPAIQERARQTLAAMIDRDYNHPSLMIWTIVNEDWGTTLALSAADRAWVAEMYDLCKRLDPTRLVVDNSACLNAWGPNVHVKSDLDDFHVYANIPDMADYFEAMAFQFSQRPLWTYSSQGDTQRSGSEPLILSEFGNWGLPSLRAYNGQEPAWFRLGSWWSPFDGMPGYPHGVLSRFDRLGLAAIWGDYETFAQAAQWHEFQALKFEVETLRRYNSIQGYVLTELTDVYWESNGVLEFNRQPKAFHDVLATINTEDVIIPQPERYAFWSDEPITVRLSASHYSRRDWRGAVLRWAFGAEQGELAVPALARGVVQEIGGLTWTPPASAEAALAHAQFTLAGADGVLAQNALDLLVLPASARVPGYSGPLAATGALAEALRRIGYAVVDGDAPLLVSDAPTPAVLDWVRAGGTLLFLSSGPSSFFWCQSRGGTYGGGWINNYSWLRPGIHRRLTTGNPLTLPFRAVMPATTMTGLPVEDAELQGDFLAGQISGWLQLPAVHTVQFRYGSGKVLMTTFNLKPALLQPTPDPVAVAMCHDLVDHVLSAACQPRLTTNY